MCADVVGDVPCLDVDDFFHGFEMYRGLGDWVLGTLSGDKPEAPVFPAGLVDYMHTKELRERINLNALMVNVV